MRCLRTRSKSKHPQFGRSCSDTQVRHVRLGLSRYYYTLEFHPQFNDFDFRRLHASETCTHGLSKSSRVSGATPRKLHMHASKSLRHRMSLRCEKAQERCIKNTAMQCDGFMTVCPTAQFAARSRRPHNTQSVCHGLTLLNNTVLVGWAGCRTAAHRLHTSFSMICLHGKASPAMPPAIVCCPRGLSMFMTLPRRQAACKSAVKATVSASARFVTCLVCSLGLLWVL